MQLGHRAIAPLHGDGGFFVHPGRAEGAEGRYALRFTQEQVGQEDGIHAHVEKGAPCQGRVEQAAVRVEHRQEAEVCANGEDSAQGAGVYDFQSFLEGGQKARPEGFHEECLAGAGGGDHVTGLCSVDRKRLLAQHGDPFFQAKQHVGMMARMRSCHIDGIEARALQEFLIAAERMGYAVQTGEGLRFIQRAGRYGVEAGLREHPYVFGKFACYFSGADNAPTHGIFHTMKVG